ncbi:MAG: hypothetical protein AAFQ87_11205 [Bacteroidota bacterium]
MRFFRKTGVAEVQTYGQVKFTEDQGFVPLVEVKVSRNPKVYQAFFTVQQVPRADLMYMRSMKMIALRMVGPDYKIGVQFDLKRHIKPLAGMMQTGVVAIRDGQSQQIISFELGSVRDDFAETWRTQVVPDRLTMDLKAKGLYVENFAAYCEQIRQELEANWMVESA